MIRWKCPFIDPEAPDLMTDYQNPLTLAVESLRAAFDSGLTRVERNTAEALARVERQMGDVVMRGEFNAVVQRLDAKDQHQDEIIAAQDVDMDRKFASVEKDIAAGFDRVARQQDEDKTRNRWVLGLIVSAASIVTSIVVAVVNNLMP